MRAVDEAPLVELQEALVEGLHAVVVAVGHESFELVRSPSESASASSDETVDDEHLDRRHPTTATGAREAGACDTMPRSDATERHARPAAAGTAGRISTRRMTVSTAPTVVHRREHELADVSAAVERGAHGVRVADLADQDHVGVLAQHVAQRGLVVDGVGPDLALR